MDKCFGFHPSIILSSSGGDAGVIGHGSGQGGSHPVPCNYDTWVLSAWRTDYDGDDEFSFQEYCYWWEDQMEDNSAFTMELWAELNPGRDWEGD